MSPKNKTLIWIVAFAAFIAVAYFAYGALAESRQPTAATSAEDLVPAPDFIVYDAEGTAFRLSDFKGKPVVVNFWASWCPPCRSEMPHFDQVYSEVKDDVMFMMVDLVDGQRETQADGQRYIDSEGFTFPVFFDTDRSAAAAYGISSIPTTIFVDANGLIVFGYRGAINEATLRARIEDILP